MAFETMSDTKVVTRVLVVDDEHHIRKAWRWMLHTDDFAVMVCESAVEALKVLEADRIDVLITDVMMPGMSGLELLTRTKKTMPEVEVIVMTGKGSIADAVQAMRDGAFDYLTKPFNEIEECINKVRQAAKLRRLRDENLRLRAQVDAAPHSALLTSDNQQMTAVLRQVAQVARVDANVLFSGPEGVGKRVVAQAMHDRSARRKGRFIVVDCGALSSKWAESELFGHLKGALPGAAAERSGVFSLAKGGTVFLDGVDALSEVVQQRLLQVLEARTIRPVGANSDVSVNVRVLASTRGDLEAAIEAGSFRHDLYLRLKVVQIKLLPLCERREDIPRLVYHFLRIVGARIGKEIVSVAGPCMEVLSDYGWVGNVRELEQVLEAAMVFADSDELELRHLPEAVRNAAATGPAPGSLAAEVDLDLPFRDALDAADRTFRVAYLTGVMQRYGSVSAAARHAQMDRANFRRLLRKFEVLNYAKPKDETAHEQEAEGSVDEEG